MKKIFKKAAAIGMLTSALAFTGLTTGCDLATSPTTEDIDNGGNSGGETEDTVITLGTTVGEVKDGVLAPTYAGGPFTGTADPLKGFYYYDYKSSDFKEGVTYQFNNASSKNILIEVTGDLKNVKLNITNAAVSANKLIGTKITIDVPCATIDVDEETGKVIKSNPLAPFDKTPVADVAGLDSNSWVKAPFGSLMTVGGITKPSAQW